MLDEFLDRPKRWLTRLQLSNLSQRFKSSDSGEYGLGAGKGIRLDGFVVYGWRWHHLGVVRDLRRLSTSIKKRQAQLCPATFTLTPAARLQWSALKDMLDHILQDNWGLHDHVEQSLFFPWIEKRLSSDYPQIHQLFLKDAALIASQRALLAQDAKALAQLVSVIVTEKFEKTAQSGTACARIVHSVRSKVDRLSEDADNLFAISEATMIPRVVDIFSRAEQLRFNDKVISNISGKQARISLVIFKHAIHDSPQDAINFQRGVPAAIRKLALPYWFKKFVAHKIRFVTDPYPPPSTTSHVVQHHRTNP